MNAADMRSFNAYLRTCTDRQIVGVYERERAAARDDYAELARTEAQHRNINLDETRSNT